MPKHDASLTQLLDMGIPRVRALAALSRSKDDAMAAAERVFAGEFDDIPSDGEEEDEHEAENGLPTPDGSTGRISERVGAVMISDGEQSDEDEDMDFDFLSDDGSQRKMQDPYATIFFSKDRVEHIVEPIAETLYGDIASSEDAGSLDSTQDSVKLLGRGEWMSGCPEGAEQSFLFQIYNSLTEGAMPCAGQCGQTFQRSLVDFFPLFPTFLQYTAHLARLMAKVCPRCSHVTCFACEQTVDRKGKDKIEGDINPALFHCPNIQAVILGMGLHMVEKSFKPAEGSPSPPTKKRKLVPTEATSFKKLLSRSTSAAKGTGYSGASNEDRSGEAAAEAQQEEKDGNTAMLLRQVGLFLPNLKRGRTFTSDYMVHPTALAHLRRRSGFINDLLRNDSLLDMTKRDTLYCALLDWLETVANHEALAAMLAMPQMRPARTEPGPTSDTVTVTYEGSPSPRELLENIVVQATVALKGLSATAAPETPPRLSYLTSLEASEADAIKVQNAALRSFCERILTARDNIDRHLADSRGRNFVERMLEELPGHYEAGAVEGKLKLAANEEELVKIYEEWARRESFKYCDLIDPANPAGTSYRHAYSDSIVRLVGMDAPKRSLAIAKELGVLSTNIPTAWGSSIFLRIDDDRVDCIKALIVGPKDTPYENGCFIFDIFLPLEYNQRCPSVKSMTTNGGRYRYNPNLYPDGKVCLSLLGTWTGPGWIAGKSTLLQVLISIQSLIMCEEPYLNEPGWSNEGGTPQSQAYSANVRRMVLVDAMANNMKTPPYPFEDVIKDHFRLKANSIRAQLDHWKELDNGGLTRGENMGASLFAPEAGTGTHEASSSTSSFDRAAAEVRRLLDELAPAANVTQSKTPYIKRNPPRSSRKQ